jgi:nucleotide-binding universal stress UspA family protein
VSEPVVFATDGGKVGATALRFVVAHATAIRASIEIISVVEPLTDLPATLPHRDELEQANARGVADRVREQLREIAGPVDWPVHVRLGRAAPAICDVARDRHARLVVLGLEAHPVEGDDTAVEVLHLAEVPVLVAREATIPRTAVVGVDFRPSSYRAALEAARLVGDGGTLHLVHVEPLLDFPAASVWDWTGSYDCAVASAFEILTARLRGDGVTDLQTHVRIGDPVAELIQAAADLDAGLLAVGSDGYTSQGRVVVGRVARRLLETPQISILATPVLPGSEAQVLDVLAARAIGGLPT